MARAANAVPVVAIGLALTLTLGVTGCAPLAPTSAAPAPATPALPTPALPTRGSTPSPALADPMLPPASGPTSGATATLAPGMVFVDVPEAGIRLPVPGGWELHRADTFSDLAARAALIARYPGSDVLLGAVDELGKRAEPVFLAIDPSSMSLAAPIASNLSVLVSQPSTSGFLLDLVAGFIGDGLKTALGATEEPERDRVQLPVGEAVRFRYRIPADDGDDVRAVAWVIGAPSGTLLVTLMGAGTALGTLDPDAIAGAIEPIPASGSTHPEPVALAHAIGRGLLGVHPYASMHRMPAWDALIQSWPSTPKERG